MMIDTTELYIFILVQVTDLSSRSQGCKKARTSALIMSQSSQSVRTDFGVQWQYFGPMSINFILSLSVSIHGENVLR